MNGEVGKIFNELGEGKSYNILYEFFSIKKDILL